MRKLHHAVAVFLITALSHAALAQEADVTGFRDIPFGTVSPRADAISRQNLCVHVTDLDFGYGVTASGSGAGNAFTLASGAARLAYEVQWNAQPGQSSGDALSANIEKDGYESDELLEDCTAGPAASATLIILLRSAALQRATAGSYSGTLSITITPR